MALGPLAGCQQGFPGGVPRGLSVASRTATAQCSGLPSIISYFAIGVLVHVFFFLVYLVLVLVFGIGIGMVPRAMSF